MSCYPIIVLPTVVPVDTFCLAGKCYRMQGPALDVTTDVFSPLAAHMAHSGSVATCQKGGHLLPAVSVYAVQIRGASFAVGSSQYRDVQMDKALRIRGCLVRELPGFTTQHQLELSRRELQF